MVAHEAADDDVGGVVDCGGGGGAELEFLPEEELEVEEVCGVFGAHEAVGPAPAAGSGGAADTVDEDFGLWGEVVVDDVGEEGDVDTTGGDVGDDEDASGAGAEAGDLVAARGLVEGAVDVGDGVTTEWKQRRKVFDVVLSCGEDDGRVCGGGFVGGCGGRGTFSFLVCGVGGGFGGAEWDLDDVLQKMQEGAFFLRAFDGEEGALEVLRDFGVGVEADQRGLLEAGFGELDERFRECGREEQCLAVGWERVEDLGELRTEAHFEETVGLVEDDVLDRFQVEFHFDLEMEKATGGGNDAGIVSGR